LALFVVTVTTSSERLMTTPCSPVNLSVQMERVPRGQGPRSLQPTEHQLHRQHAQLSGFGNPDLLDSPPRNHIRLGTRIKKDGSMVLSLRHDRRPPGPLVGDAMTKALKD
jgi:hypothetical protein